MTTEQYLASKDVTMELARDFLFDNFEASLEAVYNICKDFGVTNDMIADILQNDFPGLDGAGVSGFFDANGLDGNDLGFDKVTTSFEFSTEWLNGRTLYNIFDDDNNGKPESSATFTFSESSYTASEGFINTGTYQSDYSIYDGGILYMGPIEEGDDESYIMAIENIEENGEIIGFNLDWENTLNGLGNENTNEYFFLNQESAELFIA